MHHSSLPGSLQLAKSLGVSKVTMLGALQRLARDGVVEIRRRRPTTLCRNATDLATRLLRQRSSRPRLRRLALLVPDILLPFPPGDYWYRNTKAIIEEAAKKHIKSELLPWPREAQIPFVQKRLAGCFEAILAIGAKPAFLPSLHYMSHHRFPVLLYNRSLAWLNLPNVRLDDYTAAQRIGRLLMSHGHRNICMVAAGMNDGLMGPRGQIQGWLDFLEESGLAETSNPGILTLCHVYWQHCGFIRRLLDAKNGPTALVFAHGAIAEQFFVDPHVADIRIPEQLSVVTFDWADNIAIRPWRPPLTTATIDLRRSVECVVETVERLLAGEIDPPSIRVPLAINVTASVGPAPLADGLAAAVLNTLVR